MEANVTKSALADIEVLTALAADDLRTIETYVVVKDVTRGETLFVEGDRQADVYCVIEGRIKIARLSRSGREFILELAEPGELFGESSLFADEVHDSFAVALEDARVASVRASVLKELTSERPVLLFQLLELVELRRKRMERRLVANAVQNVRGRVASLLLQLCRDYGVRSKNGIDLRINLRRQEMANLIGVSREIVSHTLSDFRREGLIDSVGRKLIVRHMSPLEQIEDVPTHGAVEAVS